LRFWGTEWCEHWSERAAAIPKPPHSRATPADNAAARRKNYMPIFALLKDRRQFRRTQRHLNILIDVVAIEFPLRCQVLASVSSGDAIRSENDYSEHMMTRTC